MIDIRDTYVSLISMMILSVHMEKNNTLHFKCQVFLFYICTVGTVKEVIYIIIKLSQNYLPSMPPLLSRGAS